MCSKFVKLLVYLPESDDFTFLWNLKSELDSTHVKAVGFFRVVLIPAAAASPENLSDMHILKPLSALKNLGIRVSNLV